LPEYITPGGYSALLAEYEHLRKVERPKITAEVSYAASLGDRSENAEYIYGKKRLRQIDGRLHYLQRRIEALEVVQPTTVASDRIRFGAYVEVEDDAGNTETLQVVGKDEIDIANGKVSYLSPIGQAVMGREDDDEVRLRAPGGIRMLSIVRFWYEDTPT
jgi:transcription elongation factor GreB